jgi:hypothetical protein
MDFISSSSSSRRRSACPQGQVFIIGSLATFESFCADIRQNLFVGINVVSSVQDILTAYHPSQPINYVRIMVIFESAVAHEQVQQLRRMYPTVFICLYNPSLVDKPFLRLELQSHGVNQVAYDFSSIHHIIKDCIVVDDRHPSATNNNNRTNSNTYGCYFCPMSGLTEDELWLHLPAYHVNVPNDRENASAECPICRRTSERPMLVCAVCAFGVRLFYRILRMLLPVVLLLT